MELDAQNIHLPFGVGAVSSPSLKALLDDPTRAGSQALEVRKFKEKEIIFEDGQFLKGLYYLKTGCVKTLVNRSLKRGRFNSPEFINKIVGPGEIFGFKSIIKQGPTSFSAEATKESEVIIYSTDFLLKILNEGNFLFRSLLTQIADDLSGFETVSQLHYLASVQERIAYQLVLLTQKFGVSRSDGILIDLRLSRNELAQLAGTINESLSRHLTEFKNEGIIEVQGKEIIVKDLPALKRRSGNFKEQFNG